MSLLYPKVEHFFALPESGTRTRRRPDVSRTPEGEPDLSGREPDAGSPALDRVVFPKESLLVSNNLSRDNCSTGTLRPPEGVCRKPTKPLYAFSRKRDCSQPLNSSVTQRTVGSCRIHRDRSPGGPDLHRGSCLVLRDRSPGGPDFHRGSCLVLRDRSPGGPDFHRGFVPDSPGPKSW
jgi:hypothetical protein